MTVPETAIDAATEALKEKLDIEAGFALTVMFRALAETALEAAMPHLRKQVADELRVGAKTPFVDFFRRTKYELRETSK